MRSPLGWTPGRVGERGLDAALRDLASTAPCRWSSPWPARRRAGRSVAATLYFVASEALANVARHAGPEPRGCGVQADGSGWRLVVEDDGVGGADLAARHRAARPAGAARGAGWRAARWARARRRDTAGGDGPVARASGWSPLDRAATMTAGRPADADAIALAGLVVAAGGAVATVLRTGQAADRVSAGATDPAVAWLLLAGAATLVAAGA